MKIRRIKVLLAKGWYVAVWCVSYSLFSMICSFASAREQSVSAVVTQDVIKAGDLISGRVTDGVDPLWMVNITERDSKYRIVAHSVTDIEGKFALRLVNPADKLEITYVGYQTVDTVINSTYYEIRMKEYDGIPTVKIADDRTIVTMYGPLPPSISMEEFEGLGITTVDEALDGVIPGLDIVFNSGDLAYGPPVRSLMKRIDGADIEKPLVVLDSKTKRIDAAKLESFVFENFFNRKSLAGLLGVEKSSLKAVRYLQDPQSWTLYGRDGFWGVVEILTKEQYRKLKKEGKLEDDWQLLK